MQQQESISFPRADVDPEIKKGKDWLMQYAKAIWAHAERSTHKLFYNNRDKFSEYADYASGKQSISRYKPYMVPEKQDDDTWLNIDWSVKPIISKFRPISLAKIHQREFNIVVTPIDAVSRDESDTMLADIKAKILLRDQILKSNPELLNSPVLAQEPGEPIDLDEWAMRVDFGGKFNQSMGAEEGIELVHYNNDITKVRDQVESNLYDFGCAAAIKWVDEYDNVRYRACDPCAVLINDCEDPEFNDLRYFGELIKQPMSTLAKYFEEPELQKIYEANKQHGTNPHNLGNATEYSGKFDSCSALVLDIRLLTTDVMVTQKRVDKRGNVVVREADYKKKDSKSTIEINGAIEGKFKSTNISMVYEAKWVVGTNFIYDCGPMKAQPRNMENPGRTDLGVYLYAINFSKGTCQGYVERMVPSLDEYQVTNYRAQNIKNRMIPTGWAIDFDALEGVALGKGGKALSPKKLLQMFFESGVLAYRRKDIHQANQNYKPIEPLENSIAQDLIALYNDKVQIIDELRALSGLNEVTDSSTPDPKLLVGVMDNLNAATNNALYPVIKGEKSILLRLSRGILGSLQVIVKKKKVQGLIRGIGMANVKFIAVSPSIADRTFDLMIEDRPTTQERQNLLQYMNLKDSQGLIDPEDIVIVSNTHNIKQAQQILAYKIKKRREEEQAKAMQLQQQNGQVQVQSAAAAEEEKRKTLQLEFQLKGQLIDKEKEWEFKIKQLELDSKEDQIETATHGKIISTGISAAAGNDNESGEDAA